ncbi:hypothetical protein [Burkholderia cepacia]|uniref:hypothetical protein n=1 Tax=Burkholderia cepacia TaxID=292 RepID=UPI0021F47A27|nr:hypothetical protein [Burkholderia cepacia]
MTRGLSVHCAFWPQRDGCAVSVTPSPSCRSASTSQPRRIVTFLKALARASIASSMSGW